MLTQPASGRSGSQCAAIYWLLWTLLARLAFGDGPLVDRAALLSLKSACSDFGRSSLSSWDEQGYPCPPEGTANATTWPHVTCSNSGGRVAFIDLSGLDIVGTLPDRIASANALVSLDLSNNKFQGTVPHAWAGKSRFPRLRVLNLSQNELDGTLPNWNRFQAWRRLLQLDLSSNSFTGGLPASWLGTNKPLRRVEFIDLSANQLGLDADGNPLDMSQWCQPEAIAGLAPGSGWCPEEAPLNNTMSSLKELRLDNNYLSGGLPSQWPAIFLRLDVLSITQNSLASISADGLPVPSLLPTNWTSPYEGFRKLSVLILYPGNELLCSIPDEDGHYQGVNLDSTFVVTDDKRTRFDSDNPAVCPKFVTYNNPPKTVSFPSKQMAEWVYPNFKKDFLWGFRISLSWWDTDAEEWFPYSHWSPMVVKTYIYGDDGYSASEVSKHGVVCTGEGRCTLTFASVRADDVDPPGFNETPEEVESWRVEVATVNIDGSISRSVSAILLNT